MLENEQFRKISEDVGAIHRFVARGEMTAPVLPIKTAEVAKAECWQGVNVVAGHLIDFLTDERVSELIALNFIPHNNNQVRQIIFSGRFSDTNNSHFEHASGDAFNKVLIEYIWEKRNKASLVFTEHEDNKHINTSYYVGGEKGRMMTRNYDEAIQEELDKYRNKLLRRYYSAQLDWECSKKDGNTSSRHITGVGTEMRRDYSFAAKKKLEASDLADDLWLFGGFVEGAGKLFRIARLGIDRLSLTVTEVERLQKITKVCCDASQLFKEAIER